MSIRIIPIDQQVAGQFDNGKLVEQKPIGFPDEGSAVDRVGTLFYWAWFTAKEDAYLPPHPHRGFEIITYLLDGRVDHSDTLGNERTLHAGGLQVMQTGSGVQHSEKYEKGTSGFQIWFEPFMGEASYAAPTYADYGSQELPLVKKDGSTVTTILGNDSPVQLVADSMMWDVTVSAGQTYEHEIPAGYSLAGLVCTGKSSWQSEGEKRLAEAREFVVCDASESSRVSIEASADQDTRLILIQVPSVLPYPSYKQVKLRAKVKREAQN
ncbi:pirin family protein [Brevibacillus dissolubilis]|uniref:pirin family protein n=1 Tax=Brevibacillus dissolubilis TaxID=1844116 RepID=UPI0011169A73|nr:pirin family protein [Brevibacillus dissolubilis]